MTTLTTTIILCRLCHKERIPVVPFGTGTGLEGGVGASAVRELTSGWEHQHDDDSSMDVSYHQHIEEGSVYQLVLLECN